TGDHGVAALDPGGRAAAHRAGVVALVAEGLGHASAAVAGRTDDVHRAARGSSRRRAATSPAGRSSAPGTWPVTYSAGSRTSTTREPSARAAASWSTVTSVMRCVPPRRRYTPGGIVR